MFTKRKNGRRGVLVEIVRLPLRLSILLCAVNILVLWQSRRAGLIMAAGLAVYLTIAAFAFWQRQDLLSQVTAYALQYVSVERDLLDQMQVPYALMDTEARLVWGNKAFTKLTGKDPFYDRSIHSVFPSLNLDKLFAQAQDDTNPDKSRDPLLEHGNRLYRVHARMTDVKSLVARSDIFRTIPPDPFLISLFFYDETEYQRLLEKSDEDKIVVGLVYLDNYEEALETVEEVRRSLLMALIERKITKFFSDIDGIVRKTEKDKFIVVIKKNALDALSEERFHILEEVKTVNIGNTMPLTISIGMGINGGSFRQNCEYARIAIEMALARGGDQAVVKDGANISYYGGKSLQMEKTTRVKARMKAQALKEFITSKERVVVMGHKITDVDALGAAIGIYRAGTTLGKPVHIVVNDPTTSIRPLMAGFLDNPEYGTSMFVDSQTARNLVDNNTVVVVVDTNKPSYTECQELLSLTKTIVVLDHHRRGNEVIENAVLSYVEPYASSACEMVAEILQYFGEETKLRFLEADCLYAGIVIDTNNFITRAGVRTFEAAAYLRRSGADTTRVRKMLRDNIDSYKAKAEAVRTAEIYRDYFAIAVCPSEGIESPTVVGAQAANELLNIAGVKASFVLTHFNEEIYISARAIDEVNVQVLMEQLGGGGHLNIAGAQVRSTPEETKEILKKIIDRFIEDSEMERSVD